MMLDKNSIIINNISMGQYLVEAKFGYNKLWAKDSGRNLAGTMTGSLLGIFPKIILQFRKLTRSELEMISSILDSERQMVTYYDPNKRDDVTMETYTGDYEITNKGLINKGHKNEGFSCSFIAISRRS